MAPDFDQDVVVVDLAALIGITCGASDGISVGAASTGHKISDAAVFVALIVVDVAGKDDNARPQCLLLRFEIGGHLLFGRPGAVAAAKCLFIAGTGVGREVEHDEDECSTGGEMIQPVMQPAALWAFALIKSAVESQHDPVGAAHRIEPVMAQSGEPGEVVIERDGEVAVEVVVSKRRVARDTALAPDAGLAVVPLPAPESEATRPAARRVGAVGVRSRSRRARSRSGLSWQPRANSPPCFIGAPVSTGARGAKSFKRFIKLDKSSGARRFHPLELVSLESVPRESVLAESVSSRSARRWRRMGM